MLKDEYFLFISFFLIFNFFFDLFLFGSQKKSFPLDMKEKYLKKKIASNKSKTYTRAALNV